MESTDVLIVGAGPIGLELAAALGHAGVDYLIVEAQQIGHTISWFAPQTRFFSSNERIAIAGVPLHTLDQSKATREQYLQYLRTVVQIHDIHVNTYEPVVRLERSADGFVVTTRPMHGQKQYLARNVVLATGGTARPRLLDIEGEDLPHVSHYLEDPHKYFGRRVLIVGGRNSAVEAALRCHHAGAQVAISYRREAFAADDVKYWLLPEISGLIHAGRIEAHFTSVPVRITPGHVDLRQTRGESAEKRIAADFVLLLVGYVADMALLRMAGVALNGPCEIPTFDPQTMQTNVPGVFVAGTVVGGTQEKYRVFIENCHVHVDRIVQVLTGQGKRIAEVPQDVREMPET